VGSSDVSPKHHNCDIVLILADPISFDFAFLTNVYFTPIAVFGIDVTHEEYHLRKETTFF
jgi:hypothetical protein